MRSNCNWFAWREFQSRHAKALVLEKTKYSKLARFADAWWWRAILQPLGYAIGYPAWSLCQIAWVLLFGRWAHVSWMLVDGRHLEFVPTEEKRGKWYPPWDFEGEVREYDGDVWD